MDKSTDVVRIATCAYVLRDGWWVWIGLVVNENADVLWQSDKRCMTEAEALADATPRAFELTNAPPWYRLQLQLGTVQLAEQVRA